MRFVHAERGLSWLATGGLCLVLALGERGGDTLELKDSKGRIRLRAGESEGDGFSLVLLDETGRESLMLESSGKAGAGVRVLGRQRESLTLGLTDQGVWGIAFTDASKCNGMACPGGIGFWGPKGDPRVWMAMDASEGVEFAVSGKGGDKVRVVSNEERSGVLVAAGDNESGLGLVASKSGASYLYLGDPLPKDAKSWSGQSGAYLFWTPVGLSQLRLQQGADAPGLIVQDSAQEGAGVKVGGGPGSAAASVGVSGAGDARIRLLDGTGKATWQQEVKGDVGGKK